MKNIFVSKQQLCKVCVDVAAAPRIRILNIHSGKTCLGHLTETWT